jgi:ketosteroid isomerase-like protein
MINGHQRRCAIVALGGIMICSMVANATTTGRRSARRLMAATPGPAFATRANDSADVARTVERFHQALAQGDGAAALALLAPSATILESGNLETVEEYRANHLPADIEFARAVKEGRTPTLVTVRGDVAWAVATSVTQGTFHGRPISSAGAELVVLTRSPSGWRIVAIHWSSHRRGA